MNSASSVSAGIKKGVLAKNVAGTALGYYGWHLVVKPDSPVKDAAELAGKKVGITSAGSGDRYPGAVDPGREEDRLHARAARRRRTGAEPADRQYRRDG